MKNYIICLMIMMAAAGTARGQNSAQKQGLITTERFINQAALNGMKEVAAGKIAMQKAQNTKLRDYGAMIAQDYGKANTELTAIATSKNISMPSQADTTAVSSGSGNIGTRPAPDGTQTGIDRASGTTANASATGSTAKVTTGINDADTTANTSKAGTPRAMDNGSNTKKQKGQPYEGSRMAGMNDSNNTMETITESDVSSALKQLYALSGTAFDTAYIRMMIADHKKAVALFKQGLKSSDPDIQAFASKHLPMLRNHLKELQNISGN